MIKNQLDFSHHQTIETKSGSIYFIHIERNETDIESKREFEKRITLAFIRFVLKNEFLVLDYKPSGQPYITSFPFLHISISHSKGWFAFYISSKNPVGIDIQVFQSELERGQSHFVNSGEIERFKNQLTNTELYLIWGAKEATLKLFEGTVSDPKNSFSTQSIDTGSSGNIIIDIPEKLPVVLNFKVDSEKVIVYSL